MNLQEVRQKYPQYSDLSDEQLAQGLHQKFYPDLPFKEFSAKIGYAQPLQEPEEEGASLGQQLGRQLGRTGRIVAEGVGALPLAVMNAGVAARNLLTGSDYDMPSQMYSEALDAAGLPRAETGIEKGVDIAGQVIVGSKIPVPSAKVQAPAAFQRTAASGADEVIAAGQKHNVPVFFDDVTQSAIAKKTGVAAESLGSLGTGGGRAAQQKAAQEAATKVVNRLAVEGDDVPKMVQQGLKRRLGQFRESADVLYQRAAKELDPRGNIATPTLDRVLGDEIAKQQRFGTAANDELIRTLQAYKEAPRGDFSYMRELRSQIGAEISKYYGGGKAIGDKGVGALQAAKEAVEADMAQFAQASGGSGFRAWKQADGFYKANLVPFKQAGLKSLVNSPEPEKAWQFLIANGSVKSRSERLYHALDDQGRAAVRYGLAKDAMNNAANSNGTFSPARFAKYMDDHENAVNSFFRGRDRTEIKGFQNLMRHVERAGQYAENPPTGNRIIHGALATGAIGAVFSPAVAQAGAVLATGGTAVRLLFQTTRGRNLLLSAGDASAKEMPAVADRVSRFLAAAVAVSGTEDEPLEK